jgi:hypothetical protein
MRPYSGDYPPHLWAVLSIAHDRFVSVQGDWARALAPEVALAASLGWLSNILPDRETYDNKWRITPAGLTALIEIGRPAAIAHVNNLGSNQHAD